MNELKVIENELVPVYETSTGEKVVYGSELHEVLEVKSNYREWIKRRVLDIDAEEDEDFTTVEIPTVSGGTSKKTISSNWILPKKWQCLSGTKKESKYADISFG